MTVQPGDGPSTSTSPLADSPSVVVNEPPQPPSQTVEKVDSPPAEEPEPGPSQAPDLDDHVVLAPADFASAPQELPDVPEDVSPPPTVHTAESTAPQPSTQSPPSRQFPPPGTLVLVQGVVHTTDVPRQIETEDSDVHRSSTPARTASIASRPRRLSAMLNSRPQSTMAANSRPQSTTAAADVSPTPTDPVLPEVAHLPAEATPATGGNGTISSSSINVLGTLLSVAAAATAASLLTGSSEPILSSGLTPPSPVTSVPIPSEEPSPVSQSPSAPSLHSPDSTSRTERVRQAWSSIRDRLGMRSRLDEEGDRDGADARERMLSEMARAFSLGLGVGESPDQPPPLHDHEHSPLPAEGSFERFLVDLQLDLRATLSSADPVNAELPPSPPPRVLPEPHWRPPPSVDPREPRSSRLSLPAGDDEDLDQPPVPQPAPRRPSSIRAPSLDNDEAMPQLQDVSDSDSDTDTDLDLDDTDDELAPAEPGTPSSAVSPETAPTPSQPSNRINWWRLYRFPPIPAPHGSGPVQVSLRTPGSPAVPVVPMPAAMTETPTTQELPAPTVGDEQPAPASDVVVPVIVVGLQSVNINANWPGDVPTEASGEHPGVDDADNGEPRGRRWHSRAANALRNLRPGNGQARRSVSDDDTGARVGTGDDAGSRTFLIYVIGGYYPPDHSIVTGEQHNLESFEALLDLAEILGQVKPPTASKDDIERSALEVIKAAEVAHYEEDGKISSNCTERCLICLDEYAPEDDVRVMSCRHAFHQGCVDTWLQTGKNNCPACRGAGVATESPI
ncbi:hypothetical protein CYLTODRAFT_416342 [Cylindrobasidium torrendii FP15055 ss-10]|uniref:RING-type E3 ubiquitin transferase n=1 Tax=Cylindrobasidium torrendii FP15055 ss-10 TaxID=1314674 RepID=A0A0D7BU62_9AGAR|nr:hypothetical protein CYLTODRAFT_416342 [Cylindrobasidium torrendii FP15055 ss-10]